MTKRRLTFRKRSAVDTKARILQAALDEFASHGFAGARIDAIAAQARINKRMLYAYVGNKNELWLTALESVYAAKRREEDGLDIGRLTPQDGMRALIGFNFRYHVEHPEFIALVNNENLMGGRTLKRSSLVRELYSPLLETLTQVLLRGQETRVFSVGIDPMQLYVSIAALSYFYCSNVHTLSAIFGRKLASAAQMKARENHVVKMVMGYLRPEFA